MSNHIKMMLESHRRCASAIQDAANDARKAADASAMKLSNLKKWRSKQQLER